MCVPKDLTCNTFAECADLSDEIEACGQLCSFLFYFSLQGESVCLILYKFLKKINIVLLNYVSEEKRSLSCNFEDAFMCGYISFSPNGNMVSWARENQDDSRKGRPVSFVMMIIVFQNRKSTVTFIYSIPALHM